MTTMLTAALDYIGAGWAVFPLRGKVPYGGTRGHLDATTDPELVRQWWTARPQANIGAPVPDHLLVLDLDPRNGGDPDALGELPPTLTAWSGRGDGGRHLYFRRPLGPLTGSSGLPAGWDLKVNGYCVLPPSLHPATGQAYRWEHRPVAELPVAVRGMLRPAPRPRVPVSGRGTGSGEALVRFVAGQVEGNRNRGLYWAACRAAEGGILDRIADDLVNTAVTAGETRPGAQRTVDSARKAVAAR